MKLSNWLLCCVVAIVRAADSDEESSEGSSDDDSDEDSDEDSDYTSSEEESEDSEDRRERRIEEARVSTCSTVFGTHTLALAPTHIADSRP